MSSGLRIYIESVHEKKTFPCSVCKKELAHKRQLKIHIRTIHNQEKNFQCQECDKAFTQNRNLLESRTLIIFVEFTPTTLHTNVIIAKNNLKLYAIRVTIGIQSIQRKKSVQSMWQDFQDQQVFDFTHFFSARQSETPMCYLL